MMRKLTLLVAVIVSFHIVVPPSHAVVTQTSFQAEVWVDNWFALYINGKKVGEDSVPYNTEKSFNSTLIKFNATYPFEVGVLARDFMENSSGLEYIGKPNQQVGDAGLIIQIREIKTGNIVLSSSSSWKSFVIQKAPLNPSCVHSVQPLTECKFTLAKIPTSWSTLNFNDSKWNSSSEFTEAEVGVKGGYFDFSWGTGSKLIWSEDLKLDNTVLFRSRVTGKETSSLGRNNPLSLTSPDFAPGGTLPIEYTCDGAGNSPNLRWSGIPKETQSLVLIMNTDPGPTRPGEVESSSHAFLVLYNISPQASQAFSGRYPGTLGLNFKDKSPGYTPPCSQGPGAKKYTFTLYALSGTLNVESNAASEALISQKMQPLILQRAILSANYSRIS